MNILAIDTSTSICSVALMTDNGEVFEKNIDEGLTHSEILMPMVEEVIEKSNVGKRNINLVIAAKGPGSFTGIRIGVTMANTYAQVLNIPAIGVSTLDGLAMAISKTNKIICTVIDAKGGKIYACTYRKNIKTDRLIGPSLFTKEELTETLECEKDIIYIDETKTKASNLIKYYIENKEKFDNEKNYISPLYIKKSQADEK